MKILSINTCLVAILTILNISGLSAQNNISPLERKLQEAGMIDVQIAAPSLWVELKYATTDNFTKTVLYDGGLNKAYLHPLATEKLVKAQNILKKNNPKLSLLVYDTARPLSVQRKMYEVVQDTPYRNYVANPTKTGLHNYGMAVDLTICDEKGYPIDMGTSFDFFGKAAGIDAEDELVEKGVLTAKQVKNRRLLRKVMTQAGFLTIRGEWWHFNTVSLSNARKNYKVID